MKKFIKLLHPEGIPWIGTLFYNCISKSTIFQNHYRLVVHDIVQYYNSGELLDIGTGPGWLLLAIKKQVPDSSITGIDISPSMIKKAKKNIKKAGFENAIKLQDASVTNLPFPDNSLDCIVSTGSIHHWKNPVDGMQEIYRTLKNNKYALLYDLVREIPFEIKTSIKKKYGLFKFSLLWLHSFEEPFLNINQFEKIALASSFKNNYTIFFTGALCCMALKKEE